MTRWPFAIVAGLLFAACGRVPTHPTIAALPGSAKSADEFRADDTACRQTAASDAHATKNWRYDMTYLQCMYARGNQIPVPSGTFGRTQASPGSSPAKPAPVPTTAPATEPAK